MLQGRIFQDAQVAMYRSYGDNFVNFAIRLLNANVSGSFYELPMSPEKNLMSPCREKPVRGHNCLVYTYSNKETHFKWKTYTLMQSYTAVLAKHPSQNGRKVKMEKSVELYYSSRIDQRPQGVSLYQMYNWPVEIENWLI